MQVESQVNTLFACHEDGPEWLKGFLTSSHLLEATSSSPTTPGLLPSGPWRKVPGGNFSSPPAMHETEYDGFKAPDKVRRRHLAVHHLHLALNISISLQISHLLSQDSRLSLITADITLIVTRLKTMRLTNQASMEANILACMECCESQ